MERGSLLSVPSLVRPPSEATCTPLRCFDGPQQPQKIFSVAHHTPSSTEGRNNTTPFTLTIPLSPYLHGASHRHKPAAQGVLEFDA